MRQERQEQAKKLLEAKRKKQEEIQRQKQEEKIAWIRNIAKEFVKTIDPESSEKINFVKQGRSKDKDIPMAEVRFETKEIASA